MLTYRGIEYNLKESKYTIDFLGLIFYFSSTFYKEKFEKNVVEYINTESIKLKNKYDINLLLNRCLAISYYKKIEKRGFRVVEKETKKELKENELFIELNV